MDTTALHDRLFTLDSHVDIAWPETVDPFAETVQCVDMPKLRRGGVSALCLVAYIPQEESAPTQRAMAMLEWINGLQRTEHGLSARVTSTVAELDDAHRQGVIAIVPAVENGAAMAEDVSHLVAFRRLGARYMTLCHNGHNLLTDSSRPRADLNDAPQRHGGLSALGREAITEMNRLGLLVDISHVSTQGMMQAAHHSSTPVVATHSCVRALCDHPRNLNDAQLDVLRETGGLVQITAVPSFVKKNARFDRINVSDYCDHIDYVVRRCGITHVGIGSDFDGGGGFRGWCNASESPNLTTELQRRGYDEAQISAIWGGNFRRLLQQAEDAARA